MNFDDENINEIKKITEYKNFSINKGREKICRELFLSKKWELKKF